MPKDQELMAAVAAVSGRRECCSGHHVPLAHAAGTSSDEMLESRDIVAMIGGGPAHAYTETVMKVADGCGLSSRHPIQSSSLHSSN